MVKNFLACLFTGAISFLASGQCPLAKTLWDRIVWLRDSSNTPKEDQLRELRGDLQVMRQCPGRFDSAYALLLARTGWLTSLTKDFNQAIELTRAAIAMIQDHRGRPEINEAHLIKSYYNLEILYDSAGQDKLRMQAMDSCISIAFRLQTGFEYAGQHVDWKIEYLFDQGDYYSCLNYASLGENLARRGLTTADSFFYVSWKINAYIFLNQFEPADQLAASAIPVCRRSSNTRSLGSLLGLRANIAEERGDAPMANRYAMESLSYDRKVANYPSCAATLNNLGYKLYYLKLHQMDRALHFYRQALRYAQANDSIYILDNMANLYVSQGAYDLSFETFRAAFDRIQPGLDEAQLPTLVPGNVLNSIPEDYLFNLVTDLGDAYLARYKKDHSELDLEMALKVYRSGDRLMNELKVTQTELSSKLFWRKGSHRLYEHALEACALSGNPEPALYFMEKSRSVLLVDQINEQRAAGDNISLLAALRKKIVQTEGGMYGLDPASRTWTEQQRALFLFRQELTRTENLIRENSPWLYKSLLDTESINLYEVQHQLLHAGGAQAVFELFTGDSAAYLWFAQPGRAGILRLAKEEFERDLNQYLGYLAAPALQNRDFSGFTKSSARLYQFLFGDISVPAGRIVVSLDGKYFPIEALVTRDQPEGPSYFLVDHLVSYTYSLRYLLDISNRSEQTPQGAFLGVAPLVFPAALHLAPLPESDESVERIGNRFDAARVLIGPEASRAHFLHELPKYRIIQLYTHASDSSSGGEPAIYFADSTLYLSDLIPERRFAPRLIVLAACNTGNGKYFEGEGIFSFNRSFAALGIPSSLINLWSVDNQPTYRLTESFYQYLHQGLPLDEALQKAKLDFLNSPNREDRLPFYWASTVLAGNTERVAIEPPSALASRIWAGAACCGLALLFVFRRRSRE
jgi:CHAT domain-containing protein